MHISITASNIVTSGNTVVTLDQDAKFTCALSESSGVMQVTWNKLRRDSSDLLATYSARYKAKVSDSYIKKIEFEEASFSSTTIRIKNVTFEDEACYACTFDVYPNGSTRKEICLTVQGISKITTKLEPFTKPETPSETDVVITCSATGKPKPVILLKSEENFSLQWDNFTKVNEDNSITASSNLTVRLSDFRGEYVDCIAQSGDVVEQRRIRIDRDISKEGGSSSRLYVSIILLPVGLVACAVASFILYRRRKR
ncbi:OX-2 membrane glycoprotein-like [Chanos chanos]|uniref:OX-2 membrane glycoprotein-like n=1 Tax=Chanos chanos TaxID=29144 RepID=A0A6J2VUP6_CHACN|nr:OX-2 membrane glycoprotein-like [Chanos chanos]